MDVLSDVLRAVRLCGALFFDVQATEPWVAETPPGSAIVSRIFPTAGHLVPYHVVTSGSCWAGVVGQPPTQLFAGDIIMFPQGHAHVLSSAPGMRSAPNLALYRRDPRGELPFRISMGSHGKAEPARIVCGYLGCDARPYNPLLTALPPVIHAGGQGGGALATYVSLARAESKEPRAGSECVMDRLSELMFVDMVRHYLSTLPPEHTDWLAGLRDPFVGRAITALHRHAARDWTLQSLAKAVGMSRSALAERFTQFVGRPPMQYLASWRIQLAASELRDSTDNVAVIANRVGYESEAAFSRAFKKALGVPPSEWRKTQAA